MSPPSLRRAARPALASSLAALLAALSPGASCYAALAQASPEFRAISPPAAPPALSIQLPGGGATQDCGGRVAPISLLSPFARALQPPNAVSEVPPAASSPSAPLRRPAAFAARILRPALRALASPLPDFSRVGAGQAKAASAEDFARRVGVPQRSVSSVDVLAPASSGAALPALARAVRRRAEKVARSVPLYAGLWATGTAPVSSAHGIVPVIATFAVLLPSLILHEMGHGWAAYVLGDRTAAREGRLSFWPPTKLLTHIDPIGTIAVPLATTLLGGFFFGWAKPVSVSAESLGDPRRDFGIVAFAGPLVNMALLGLALAATVFLSSVGAPAAALTTVKTFGLINAMLAAFNLIPLFPMDGHHILMALLPPRAAQAAGSFWSKLGPLSWLPFMIFIGLLAGPFLSPLLAWISGLFAAAASGGALLASAGLPAVAALGLLAGQIEQAPPTTVNEGHPVAASSMKGDEPAEVVVVLSGAKKPLATDAHLSFIDTRARSWANDYSRMLRGMMAELSAAGLDEQSLNSYAAAPIATYARINAATLRLDRSKVGALAEMLTAQGHAVFSNEKRTASAAASAEPDGLNAEAVLAAARRTWGDPEAASWPGWMARLLGAVIPQPALGVVETEDGSQAAPAVLSLVPWNRNVTRYRAFDRDGSSLDDVLKSLTVAANDGNLVIFDGGGSGDRRPQSPDSLLIERLAREGHVVVSSARSAGAVGLLATVFGVTRRGPGLRAVHLALERTRADQETNGAGWDVESAYRELLKSMEPSGPGALARLARRWATMLAARRGR